MRGYDRGETIGEAPRRRERTYTIDGIVCVRRMELSARTAIWARAKTIGWREIAYGAVTVSLNALA